VINFTLHSLTRKRNHNVSVEQFAELVGVTSERIYQLIQSGLPHRKRDEGTRIVPKDAIKWLRQRDRDEAVVEKALDEAKERARKTRAREPRKTAIWYWYRPYAVHPSRTPVRDYGTISQSRSLAAA
jgi:hypothetical protein